MTAKLLSIIIVNWNTWQEAAACLDAVSRTVRKTAYEIILIDNASREDRSGVIQNRFPDLDLRIIRNPGNPGFARACNQGIDETSGRYALLLNPDTRVREGAIDRSIEWMEAYPETGVLGCRLLNRDGAFQHWTAGKFPALQAAFNHYFFLSLIFPGMKFFQGMFRYEDSRDPEEVDWVCGAFFLARREAIEAVGNLDKRFFLYGEDIEWCYRMQQSGWKVVYFPQAETLHDSGKSVGQLTQGRYRQGLEGLSLFFKLLHPAGWKNFLFNFITAAGFLFRTVLYSVKALPVLLFSSQKKAFDKARASWKFFVAALSILGNPPAPPATMPIQKKTGVPA